MKNNLIAQLQSVVNNTPENDVNFVIADYLLRAVFDEKRELTINEIANKCYTSPATVSRFARQIGYDSFQELKKRCEISKSSGTEILFDNLENMNFDFVNDRQILMNFAHNISESLEDLVIHLNFEEIDKLIELIHDSENVYIFGIQLSGLFAQHLQFLLMNMGKVCRCYTDGVRQDAAAKSMPANSIAIILSVDGNLLRERRDTLFDIKENNAKLILITQNPTSKWNYLFDQIVYLGNFKSAKNGRYKLQFFLEIILNRYTLKYNK